MTPSSFKCEYTILMQMSIPPDNLIASYDPAVRRGADEMVKAVNAFLRTVAAMPSVQTFRLSMRMAGASRLMRALGGAEAALEALYKPR